MWCFLPSAASGAEHRGRVLFGGLPVPGATVTATHAGETFSAVTDAQGAYVLTDLADGTWSVRVEMLCFAPTEQEVAVGADALASQWDLKLLPFDDIKGAAGPTISLPAVPAAPPAAQPASSSKNGIAPADATTAQAFQRTDLSAAGNAASNNAAPPLDSPGDVNDLSERAADALLINGTANNGAASPFAQPVAFGNNRRGFRFLYRGNVGLIIDHSALDARSYSITGQNTSKPDYSHLQVVGAFSGPLRIPGWHPQSRPMLTVNFQWSRNRNVNTQAALVPSLLQRAGDLTGLPAVIDPTTGKPFAENKIPDQFISAQAKALLGYYPFPNFDSPHYNYQVPVSGLSRRNALQARIDKSVTRKDQVSGGFNYEGNRSTQPNLFNFVDTTTSTGINTNIAWRHTFTVRLYGDFNYQFSRLSNRTLPYFANREDVSGNAGITGNDQTPNNWGPPSLNFASGILGLSDAPYSVYKPLTHTLSYTLLWNHGRHNVLIGADFRRQQFNYYQQLNGRGSFTFTGAAAGNDFGGFLLGLPDTSAVAFGNADKYFRATSYDGYFTDDWRVKPAVTINAGVRWEHWGPVTERYGRLVNLDVAGRFASVAPIVGSNPTGALTGKQYPGSLLDPYRPAWQPRIGLAWRPFPASSMVVRVGYGVYYDTSIHESIALRMAQQSPLSKSLSVQNTASNPLTLANGFIAPAGTTPNTFAVDPGFRAGYAQTWQASVQRDLPAGLMMTVTYLGTKGTHGQQQYLPNTYPEGAVNPCPSCPAGFIYLASNGNSTRHSGQLLLRRRLRNGFTASLQYTLAKAIDDAAMGGRGQGGAVIAQDWLNLRGECALSNSDQRHQAVTQLQYTSGMGIGGGALMQGWRGALLKEWSFVTQITLGSGTPLTPIYLAAVKGTGVTGSIRPDYTGAPLYDGPAGHALNPAAFTAPAAGQWGNARRNSITGPSQFTMSASMSRTFRLSDRFTGDLRIDATNPLNHVTYPSWNTTITSAQFGLPGSANAMRSVQSTLRVRF